MVALDGTIRSSNVVLGGDLNFTISTRGFGEKMLAWIH